MRRRWTLIVLAIATAVMGALLILDLRRPSTEESRRAREVIAPGIAARGAATRIEIERAGAAKVLLERDGPIAWRLAAPDGRRADGPLVEQLLGLLDFAQIERRVAGPLDAATLRTLGLEVPRVRLRAGALALDIGGDDPASRGVYVRRSGERDAFVIERRLLELVDVAPEAFVSRRLLLVEDRDSARALDLIPLDGKARHLTRTAAGWLLDDGKPAPDALLRALDAAPATRILPAAPTPPPREPARLTLRRDGTVDAALLPTTDPACAPAETIARSDGARLCVPAAALAPLLAK